MLYTKKLRYTYIAMEYLTRYGRKILDHGRYTFIIKKRRPKPVNGADRNAKKISGVGKCFRINF
jgi:hypothetical protein